MAIVPTIVDILEGWERKCGSNKIFINHLGAVITATENSKAPRLDSIIIYIVPETSKVIVLGES